MSLLLAYGLGFGVAITCAILVLVFRRSDTSPGLFVAMVSAYFGLMVATGCLLGLLMQFVWPLVAIPAAWLLGSVTMYVYLKYF